MGDISRHKRELRGKQRELRDLLAEWDPIGIIGEDGEPRDEYDCLLGIIGDLRQGMNERDLRLFLASQLQDHFGFGSTASSTDAFAHLVFHWYWRGTGVTRFLAASRPVPPADSGLAQNESLCDVG